MYPAKFDYVRAGSVQEAVALLQQNEDAKLMAGGHSLIPLMKLRLATPTQVIDIGRIAELRGIRREGNGLVIGALTTHSDIAASADVRALAPALADAASHVGDQQVRNRGTLGGNIAHADPASDLPTVLTALDARIRVQGPNGRREIAAQDFFIGLMTTTIEPTEVLVDVAIPAAPHSAYIKYENQASGYALIGVCAALEMSGGTVSQARVAMGGPFPAARRLAGVEAALRGRGADAFAEAAQHAADGTHEDDWIGDIHASAAYRRSVAPVFVERALRAAAK